MGGGGELLNLKCVFWFSLQLFCATFFILGSERDIIINVRGLVNKFPD